MELFKILIFFIDDKNVSVFVRSMCFTYRSLVGSVLAY